MKFFGCALLLVLLVACAPSPSKTSTKQTTLKELERTLQEKGFSDPRYSILLAKSYALVATRPGVANSGALRKKARQAERGRSILPQRIRYRRSWRKVDLEQAESQRERLLVLLGALHSDNEALFPVATLAQANFDCWLFEMRRSRDKASSSACALDLRAALGEGESRADLAYRGIYPTLTQRSPSAEGDLLGGQFAALAQHLSGKRIGELTESIERKQQEQEFQRMQRVLEERIEERVIEEMERHLRERVLPLAFEQRTWRVFFKLNKTKFDKQGERAIKSIVAWYREAPRGAGFIIERLDSEDDARNLSDLRIEKLLESLLGQGVPRSAIGTRLPEQPQEQEESAQESAQEQAQEDEQAVADSVVVRTRQ